MAKELIPARKTGLAKTLTKALSMWQLYVLILPAIAYLFIFHIMPMYGVQIAFKDFRTSKGIWDSPWVGLKHFKRFVTYPNFWKLVRNTIALSLYSLATFPLPVMLALLINEVRNNRFKKTVQMITYAPHFISVVVLCSMVTLFLSPSSGAINKFIEFFGGKPVSFMASAPMFKWIYVISGIWQGVGWSSIIFTAALAGVDRSLLEAADIDGATRIQKIWYVNVPVLIPTIVIMLILQCGSLLSVGYEKVYLLQNDFNMTAAEVISTYTYKVGLEQADFAFSTAVGVLNSVVNSIILIIVNAISRRVSETALW